MSTDTHILCDSCDGEVFDPGDTHVPVDTVVTHVECQLRELAKVRADAWRVAVRPVAEVRARLAEVEAERDEERSKLETLAHNFDVFVNLYDEACADREAARPVVEAAVAYENRWRRYASIDRDADWVQVRAAKASAHQALLDAVRAAAVDLYRSATSDHPTGHRYLSTACHHGLHDQCGVVQAERGEDGPPHCKHCRSVCICPKCRHQSTTEEKP